MSSPGLCSYVKSVSQLHTGCANRPLRCIEGPVRFVNPGPRVQEHCRTLRHCDSLTTVFRRRRVLDVCMIQGNEIEQNQRCPLQGFVRHHLQLNK